MCANGPLAIAGVVPAVARGISPEVAVLPVPAAGLPAGRFVRPAVGLGLALAAAAAAAAAKPPVGLWQSMQSEEGVLFSCAPSVLVLSEVPNHFVPDGA